MKTLIFLTILGLLPGVSSYALNNNSVVSGGSLIAAKERAQRENKLLILEFTAKWCLPCWYMEKNVFSNEQVQKYSDQHAIIFPIDIDENKSLKEEYNIEVLPTMILMQASGLILSKKEESLNADAFIHWIEKNKNLNPDSEKATTAEQALDEPVTVELPNLNTKEFEPELMKQLAESNNKKEKAAAGNENNYYVQAGVFTNKANAENMVALLNMNFQEETKIVEAKLDSSNVFKVIIGNFGNKEEAIIFKQVLEKYKFKAVIRHN